ncbi:MAG: glycosyltransferase family 1 protein [Planctomycetota bacterium]|nr:MAG: glycosyltransferase family 1 protein [Planctomycetota bacterium]
MRVLFFTHPGTNSRDILLDMALGFEKAGHEVIQWELEPWANLFKSAGPAQKQVVAQATAMFSRFIEANRIDLSIGMWANALGSLAHGFRDGQPVSFFELTGHPHLMFWLDAPHWAGGGSMQELFGSPLLRTERIRHYVNNAGIAREMMEVLGFGATIGRRYGINEDVFRPYPEQARKYDIVFGLGPGDGKPSELMLRELESDDPDVDAIRAERADSVRPKLVDCAQSFAGEHVGAMIELFLALLDRRLGPPGRPMLDDLAALESSGHAEAGRVLRANPKALVRAFSLLRSIDAWRRAFTITHLSQRLNCAVFGSASLEHWPCRATMLGDLQYQDMARAYSSGLIGLNAMRWQDDIGLNLKPYEITASGACLLCDGRVGFEEAFEPGVEAECFQSPGEALQKARSLVGDPDRARQMADAGRARTLRDHTWSAAADELIEFAINGPRRLRQAA